MTTTTGPNLVEAMEEEHGREIVSARASLLANLTAARHALRAVRRAQASLQELYDVEHTEGGQNALDFDHYLDEAERALRVAEALNPTRLGFSRPHGCETCGQLGGELTEHYAADPRAPRVVCVDTEACGRRCTALVGGETDR
jgi:hypothetical protein